MPQPLTALYYNPLASDWNEYRNTQVARFLAHFWKVSKESGLPEEKLFSHQISPRVNPDWNPELLAVDKSIDADIPYKLGINLYGGATNSDYVRKFLLDRRFKEYGVPEFHSQASKDANASLRALESHYRSNAVFVSPYYMSLAESFPQEKTGLNKFLLNADNSQQGSDLLYQAIVEFAKR